MSEAPTRPGSRDQRFIGYLQDLVAQKNRAALAALRRGLGRPPGHAPEMYPYVMPFLAESTRPREEAAYFLTATLFALWHQGRQDQPPARHLSDLGASLAALRALQAHERGQSPEAGDSLERRFVALLSSEWNDLPYQLRQLVSLLRTREVPIDWQQLLRDLQDWDHPNRRVQRCWARSFWRAAASGEPEQSDTQTADTTQATPSEQ
ncbi:type I-E CRISPR-associated protein Cse2/CasB [Kallotenue papyrolyticum]|uniref:type I-E CRISPR-associated protein Cse2/CasB n=1 Tax=Kallotenue papyrolyticum TaxID=1325125 RepID=UPI00046F31C6|nr:type I-E CRISPR-associated protein Cse2/CasB [Kallotenue papyrolyticum]